MSIELVDFSTAYIERSNKETEEFIANENAAFLNESIQYLKKNKQEFIYIESHLFEELGIDSLCLELDDIFGTYDVILGLKLQKKYEDKIKSFLNSHLLGEDAKFDLMFDQKDGLWSLNYTLNYSEGFSEGLSLHEAFSLIYEFLLKLVSTVKEQPKQ